MVTVVNGGNGNLVVVLYGDNNVVYDNGNGVWRKWWCGWCGNVITVVM